MRPTRPRRPTGSGAWQDAPAPCGKSLANGCEDGTVEQPLHRHHLVFSTAQHTIHFACTGTISLSLPRNTLYILHAIPSTPRAPGILRASQPCMRGKNSMMGVFFLPVFKNYAIVPAAGRNQAPFLFRLSPLLNFIVYIPFDPTEWPEISRQIG